MEWPQCWMLERREIPWDLTNRKRGEPLPWKPVQMFVREGHARLAAERRRMEPRDFRSHYQFRAIIWIQMIPERWA